MTYREPQPGDIYLTPDGSYLMLIKREARSKYWYELYSLSEEQFRYATIQSLNIAYKLISDD